MCDHHVFVPMRVLSNSHPPFLPLLPLIKRLAPMTLDCFYDTPLLLLHSLASITCRALQSLNAEAIARANE